MPVGRPLAPSGLLKGSHSGQGLPTAPGHSGSATAFLGPPGGFYAGASAKRPRSVGDWSLRMSGAALASVCDSPPVSFTDSIVGPVRRAMRVDVQHAIGARGHHGRRRFRGHGCGHGRAFFMDSANAFSNSFLTLARR